MISIVMKRTLNVFIIILMSLMSFQTVMAQDIIHTYDSAPIKAKILEIGDNYLYYKTWDNPDGPLYNMSLSRVTRIVFENGTTKVFTQISPYIGPGPYGAYPLDYRWGSYYSPYGRISPGNLSDYLGYTLYGSEYMKARNQFSWGFALTGMGVGGLLISITAHLASIEMDSMPGFDNFQPSRSGSNAGIAVGYVLSAGCIGAGIPLWVKGSKGLRKIADDYNRTYINPGSTGTNPNLSLGTTRNGIGLAFNF